MHFRSVGALAICSCWKLIIDQFAIQYYEPSYSNFNKYNQINQVRTNLYL